MKATTARATEGGSTVYEAEVVIDGKRVEVVADGTLLAEGSTMTTGRTTTGRSAACRAARDPSAEAR